MAGHEPETVAGPSAWACKAAVPAAGTLCRDLRLAATTLRWLAEKYPTLLPLAEARRLAELLDEAGKVSVTMHRGVRAEVDRRLKLEQGED